MLKCIQKWYHNNVLKKYDLGWLYIFFSCTYTFGHILYVWSSATHNMFATVTRSNWWIKTRTYAWFSIFLHSRNPISRQWYETYLWNIRWELHIPHKCATGVLLHIDKYKWQVHIEKNWNNLSYRELSFLTRCHL